MAQTCRTLMLLEVRQCSRRQFRRTMTAGCSVTGDSTARLQSTHRLTRNVRPEIAPAIGDAADVMTYPLHKQHRRNSTFALDTRDTYMGQPVKPFEDIPGPKPLPIFGGLHHYFPGGKYHGMDMKDSLSIQQAEYGDICKDAILPGLTIVHLFNPDDIQTMYRHEGPHPKRDAFFMLSHYNRKYNNNVQGLLTSQHETWYRFRSSSQQKLMKPKATIAYLQEQQLVADDLLMRIHESRDQKGDVEDLKQDLYKYAAESIGVVCFSRRMGAFRNNDTNSEASKFIDAVNTVMDISSKEFTITPFWRLFPTPTFKRLAKAQSYIRDLAVKYSHESVLRAQEKLDQDQLDGESGDLVPYLMTQTALKPAEVVTLISELIFAGVDTTCHLLAFCLYALAKNPEKQAKLYEEVNTQFPNKSPASGNKLSDLSYMKAVFKETLRRYPVAGGTCRTTNTDMVCSGYNIPAGTFVAVHFDWIGKQNRYFPDSNTYRPERWLRGAATDPIHPFAQLPFGHGARSCLGRRLAEQEVSLALIKIMQHYKVEFDGELKIRQSTTYGPDSPLHFRFLERE